MVNFVNLVQTRTFIFSGGIEGGKKLFLMDYQQPTNTIKNRFIGSPTWWSPFSVVTEPASGPSRTNSFYVELFRCLLSTFHWLLAQKPRTWNGELAFSKANTSFSLLFFLPLPLSCSYTCRHLRRYVYVLDKLYFPHSHCSTLQHCFSTLSDNGEELLSLTCSHILRSYAARLLTSLLSVYCMLHVPCLICAWFFRETEK